MRQLSRLTAGLSIGAVAATGATAAVVGVGELLSHGTSVLSLALGDGGAFARRSSGRAHRAVGACSNRRRRRPACGAGGACRARAPGGARAAGGARRAGSLRSPATVQIAPPTGTRAHATTGGS